MSMPEWRRRSRFAFPPPADSTTCQPESPESRERVESAIDKLRDGVIGSDIELSTKEGAVSATGVQMSSLDGERVRVDSRAIEALRARLAGPVLEPAHPAFEEATR